MSRVFITGSSTGLGLMAGRVLAEQGHQVVLHARDEGEQVMRGPPYPLRLTSSLVMPHAFTICTGWPRN